MEFLLTGSIFMLFIVLLFIYFYLGVLFCLSAGPVGVTKKRQAGQKKKKKKDERGLTMRSWCLPPRQLRECEARRKEKTEWQNSGGNEAKGGGSYRLTCHSFFLLL